MQAGQLLLTRYAKAQPKQAREAPSPGIRGRRAGQVRAVRLRLAPPGPRDVVCPTSTAAKVWIIGFVPYVRLPPNGAARAVRGVCTAARNEGD